MQATALPAPAPEDVAPAAPRIRLFGAEPAVSGDRLRGTLLWSAAFDGTAAVFAAAQTELNNLLAEVAAAVEAAEELPDVLEWRAAVGRLNDQATAAASLRASLVKLDDVVRRHLEAAEDPTHAEEQIEAVRTELARREGRIKVLTEAVAKLQPDGLRALAQARAAALRDARAKAEAARRGATAELLSVAEAPVAAMMMTGLVMSGIPQK